MNQAVRTVSGDPKNDSDEESRSRSSTFETRPTKQSVAERRATAADRAEAFESQNVTFCQRFKLLFKPIYAINTIDAKGLDSKTHIVIVPEAFRMLFYAAFILFLLIGYVITTASGNLDINNNPIKSRFGTNNMCIYFDEKPFIYISSSLWVVLLMIVLMYEFTEWYRVHDCYRDDRLVSKCTYTIYCMCSIFEIFAYIYFVQVFAVRPNDNIFVHTLPYYAFVLALWMMSFKHAIYFYDIKIFKSKAMNALLFLYIAALLATVVGKVIIGAPNLFGAKLWEQSGYEWTPTFSDINGDIYLFLTIPTPIISYFFIIEKLDKINIVVNRDRIRVITPIDPELIEERVP